MGFIKRMAYRFDGSFRAISDSFAKIKSPSAKKQPAKAAISRIPKSSPSAINHSGFPPTICCSVLAATFENQANPELKALNRPSPETRISKALITRRTN